MIRSFAIFLCMYAAFSVSADELCSEWESNLAEDMRIPESEFTQVAAEKSLEHLQRLVQEPKTDMLSGFAYANSLKFIDGWILKKVALDSLMQSEGSRETDQVNAFCEWLVVKAFYHD